MVMSGQSTTNAQQYALEDNVQDFLKNHMDSLVKWDLVRFFHDNPHTKDTAEKIAHYTARDVTDIVRELKGLVRAQVLQVNTVGGVTVYQLAADDRIRRTIDGFMAACHDRAFRTKIIHHVIQCMRQQQQHN